MVALGGETSNRPLVWCRSVQLAKSAADTTGAERPSSRGGATPPDKRAPAPPERIEG